MKTISEIYTEYKTMSILQEHTLRVAAVASLICDNFNEPIQKEIIVATCLLHDMGSIVKFKIDRFPELNKPEGTEYWQKVQKEYIAKYGNSEAEATGKILRELNLDEIAKIFDFFVSDNPYDSDNVLRNDNFMLKICLYADERVTPFGVVSFQEHLLDNKKRMEKRGVLMSEEKFLFIKNTLSKLEEQIFSKCRIKPEDINDESVRSIIAKLKNFIIKNTN